MPSNLKLSVQSVTPDVTLTLSDPYIGSAYSPQVDVSEIDGGHEVAITYKAPSGITTDTFDVLDGVDGTDGTDGVDGVSPTVEIESTTDAHTITITDADGEHTYEVSTYADEEAARATAESSRVAAESSRVTAEQARVTAESSRTAAESARVTAEASRATAEQSRAAAETARESAESTRVTAETARATAESARATAETTRDTAEQSRATAETARASAESGRVTAEQGRASAENARASAESARVMAESARASAETSRTTAESARATAESTRATEWATIKTEAQDTTRAAEDATDAAQDAAADATAAAAEARAASAATWLSGNVLFGELAEGAVLTADDVYTAPPKGVEVYGVSTQASYTGKNQWDEEWELGRLDITTGADVEDSNYIRAKNYIPVMSNTTYYIYIAGSETMWLAVGAYNSDKQMISWLGGITGGRTFTTPSNCRFLRFYVTGNYGTTYKHDICINVSDATFNGTYEPYTGGKAAPSPDYPQPIESVDDLTLVVAGKNLIENTKQSDTKLGISFTVNADKSITVSGTSTGQPTFALDTIKIPAGSYYLSGCPSGLNNNAFIYFPGTSITGDYGNGRAFTIAEPMTLTPTILVRTGTTLNATFKPQLEVGSAPTAYVPYVGQSVPIPLSDHSLRSLPDGTRDTLTLTYQGPSTEHEGWGVFGKTLTQKVDVRDLGDIGWVRESETNSTFYSAHFASIGVFNSELYCTDYVRSTVMTPANMPDNSCAFTNSASTPLFRVKDAAKYASCATAAAFKAAVTGVKLAFKLREPITHDLGTVELPILPCPLTAWADGGSAQPTMSMGYEQDINIVIPRIEAAISDLATS